MKTLNKSDRVKHAINRIIRMNGLNKHGILDLKVSDLADNPSLEDVGGRTILNVLKEVKQEMFPEEKERLSTSKRKRVWDYLEERFSVNDLETGELKTLTYHDVKDEPALRGIGKTTITCTIGDYKKRLWESHDYESFTSYPKKERSKESYQKKTEWGFQETDYNVLKSIIKQNEVPARSFFDKQEYELRELKMALHHMGINHRKLLRAYWEDISQISRPKEYSNFDF